MIPAKKPLNEEQRQEAVERYEILDTRSEACFDDITDLMSQITGAPISLITMLDNDRNYLKSHHGVPFTESPRDLSFCGHAINSADDIMIVEDARLDKRFHDNPLVAEHGAVFYAGVPLVTPDGHKLGTLCLFDQEPRKLSGETTSMLKKMAKQVEFLLDLRLKNAMLTSTKNQLEQHNQELSKFARSISHDIKSPLTSLLYLTDSVIEDAATAEAEDHLSDLKKIKHSAMSLSDYADALLEHYLSGESNRDTLEPTDLKAVFNELKVLLGSTEETTINVSMSCESMLTNKASLNQVLLNIVSNAIKYCDKPHVDIQIDCSPVDDGVQFSIQDNGMGIPIKELDAIFNLFDTGNNVDRFGVTSTGIGLHAVKSIVESLGGDIGVTSEIGVGSIFTFTLPSAVEHETIIDAENLKAA